MHGHLKRHLETRRVIKSPEAPWVVSRSLHAFAIGQTFDGITARFAQCRSPVISQVILDQWPNHRTVTIRHRH